MRARLLSLLAGLLALVPAQAFASFHLMKVVEVFPGTAAAPNAQYVVLQMYSGGQNFINGHEVSFFGVSGNIPTQVVFNANVPVGTNQSRILIATAEAQAFFGITPDFVMPALIDVAGGKVCFDAIPEDCVGWGARAGDNSTGTPSQAMRLGRALKRRLNIVGGANTLESGDDTNNSSNDFVADLPTPRNNANALGTIPGSTCANGSLEGLEGCDDGNLALGDGCDAACEVENCGNGLLDNGEECDDANNVNTDGCIAGCILASCGDGFIRAGVETCDDGNILPGDGCDQGCQVEIPADCGNGVVEGAEECDDTNNVSGDGCAANCVNEFCGDGIINNVTEGCDDGNAVAGDGCSGACAVEVCGDGVLQAKLGEECDDGNLTDGDGCNATCALPFCGNSIVDPGETCDDGNEDPEDGCDPGCAAEFCGDGFVQGGLGEECDNGEDNADTAACLADCTAAACGDGLVQAGVEGCDDGNTTAGDGCDAACNVEEDPELSGGGLCAVRPSSGAFGLLPLWGLGMALALWLRRRRG